MDAIMKYMSRIHRCFRLWQSDQMDGLSGIEQNYLFHICMKPGISQEQLSEHIMVNKSNVARKLSNLESEGWIFRTVSETDKRIYQIYPTEKALEVLPEIKKLMKTWNEKILEDLSDEEKDVLFTILPKITKKAKNLAESEEQK